MLTLRHAIVPLVAVNASCIGASVSVDDPSEHARTAAAEPHKVVPPADPRPLERPPAQLLVGRWLMTHEESGDDTPGIESQGRRRLKFTAAGLYELENYLTQIQGLYVLTGTSLALTDLTDKSETITSELLSISQDTLIMLEDLPKAYERGGPPRRVRITYRRIREGDFGPLLGSTIRTSKATAGTYWASYDYRLHKLPTMEVTIDKTIRGHGRIELSVDGKAQTCFGMLAVHAGSRSKYASRDAKHHNSKDTQYWLSAARGTWRADGDVIVVDLRDAWRGTCDTSNAALRSSHSLELRCVSVAANDKLPAAALACQLGNRSADVLKLALNPADSERAGPYTLQSVARQRFFTDPGQPWIFLSNKGLAVTSRDDRKQHSPIVSFATPALPFDESRYIPPAAPAKTR